MTASCSRPRRCLAVLLLSLATATGGPPAFGALTAAKSGELPAGALRGPETRLRQYPTVSLATPAQREAAADLLAEMRATAGPWRDPLKAAAAGFDTHAARHRLNAGSVGYLHAEHRRWSNDRVYLDPHRPEALIYANVPGRRLVLVGMMFSMPRGRRGPNPGGPITRWHTHRVCARGNRRGLAPRADGSCPPGSRSRQGSEMLHAWFTRDLRSAYAIHAPERELGLAGLLPAAYCRLP
jgi:hypothetical protein